MLIAFFSGRKRDRRGSGIKYIPEFLPKTALTEKLKTAGGRWNPEERVWRVCFGAIRGDTTLVERIVRE